MKLKDDESEEWKTEELQLTVQLSENENGREWQWISVVSCAIDLSVTKVYITSV